MKKFLLLLAVMLTGIIGSGVQAKYELGDQLASADLKDGDTVILEYVASQLFADRYLTVNNSTKKGMLGDVGVIDDEKVWVLEEGPNDLRYESGKTFYLKNVATGLYVVADGGYSNPFSTTSDIDKAANIFFPSCGADIPFSNCIAFDGNGDKLKDGETGDKIVNWGTNGDGIGEVTEKSVGLFYSRDGNGWSYMTCYFGTISFTGLQMCNQWNVFKAKYINDKLGDLDALINLYSTFSPVGGTEPGYYETEAAERYNDAMQKAVVMLLTSGTDEEIDAMMAELKEAKQACEDAVIPITAGYYYIVSAYDEFLNVQGVEKAAFPNTTTNKVAWKTLDTTNGEFIFYIEPAEEANMFYVQNFFTDQYCGKIDAWTGSGATTPLVYGKSYTQRLTMEVEGMFLWSDPSYSYPGSSNGKSPFGGNGNGETVEGTLAAWGRTSDANDQDYIFNQHTNLWYIRPVSDEIMDTMEPIKQQNLLTKELDELIQDSRNLYGNLFSYTVDTDSPLITVANGGVNEDPTEDNQITFQTIRRQGIAGADAYNYLIDDLDTTYMQGSGYIDVDISKTPVDAVAITYNTRDADGNGSNPNWQVWGAQERPDKVNVYASNEKGEGAKWNFVGSAEMGALDLPATAIFSFGTDYKYVRYEVLTNASGGAFFTISEFQLYKTKADETTSQYYTTDGLKDKADALMEVVDAKVAIVDANTATKEDIQELQAAYDAVKALYADTTELAELIAESEILLEGVVVGDEMGQLSDATLEIALQTAIENARKNAFTTPISVAAVIEATNAVRDAKNAFLAGIKSFEVGKWYFITNLDEDRFGDAGTEEAFCGGSAIYLNSKYAGSAVTKWGLFDQSSMTLNADNNPKAMWRFVPVEGTSYYAIQNMYNGYYLGDFAGENINMPVSEEPVPYDVAYSGNAQFRLYPRGGKNTENMALWPEGYEADVVCHVVDGASAWTFIEVNPDEQEAISISDFAFNLIDVMALPYNISGLADYNSDVQTYAVKKITQAENEEGELITTVELYEKSDFKAGEPCIIVLGSTDEDVETEPFDLVIPFPTEMIDHTVPVVSNGIVGGLHSLKCAEGTAISTGKKFIPVGAGGNGFDAQTGIIDLSTYKGEVAGVETALTLEISGMAKLSNAADVNGDGEVNTADVVAVYNWIIEGDDSGITKEVADVDGDGEVSTADIVAIYNVIVGEETASSPQFRAQMQMLLKGQK